MSAAAEISGGGGLEAIRKLDEIGGDVDESEIIHHLGEAAVIELLDLAEQGLVEARTTFSLTGAGRQVVKGGS